MTATLPAALARLAPDPAPDGELLRRWAAHRDEAAFAAVVRRHVGMVAGTCRRVLRNPAAADDATQAAFVLLARKAAELASRRCVGNWLYGVAYHTALKASAMAATRRAKEAKAAPAARTPPADDLTALDEELAKLPDHLRGPLVLCDLEGVSRRDAAARLGVPEGTISSRRAAALRKLKVRLSARGVAGALALLVASRATESATAAAVSAATHAPPPAVAALASEVSKMLLFAKLKTGAAVLAAVLAVGFSVTALSPVFAADEPKAKPPEKKEEPKKDEPAWKADFRKAYGLKDGQLVRRVAPPYPDCRVEYFRDVIREVYKRQKLEPNEQAVNTDRSKDFTVFGWKDGWMADGLTSQIVPIKPEDGVRLEQLLDMTLGFAKTRIESDLTTLARKVMGDFVVRAGADPEKAAMELEAILRTECGVPVKLSFRDSEEEVFVLSGKYRAAPLDDRKVNEIEVYSSKLTERGIGGGGSGTFQEMTEHVERWVSKPVVVGKIDGLPKKVEWHYNSAEADRDRNAQTVLDNIAKQTGLEVTAEKRKVRVLVAEHADIEKGEKDEPKKEPEWKADFDTIYTLKDGEDVRYVPLTDAAKKVREDYYREVIANGKKGAKPLPGTVIRFDYHKGEAKWMGVGGGAHGGEGKTGMALEHVLGAMFPHDPMPGLEIDPKLLGVYLPGDWVVRTTATPEERVKGLAQLLKGECKLAVELELKDVEREVLVASGGYKFAPRKWRKDEAIDVYALEQVVEKGPELKQTLTGGGDFNGFLRQVGEFCGKRVVAGEVKNPPKALKWYLHERNSEKVSEQQEDRDPNAILKNVSEQTGLTFKAEKRKVPVLTAKGGK